MTVDGFSNDQVKLVAQQVIAVYAEPYLIKGIFQKIETEICCPNFSEIIANYLKYVKEQNEFIFNPEN